MKKKLLVGMLILGSMGILSGCGTAKLNLSDYVKVEFDGVDGKGMVSNYYLDTDKLDDAIKDANDDLSKRERQRLIESIELEIKKNSTELSNGDKVKVDIDWSERRAEKYGFEFSGDEKEVKVKGLKELESVDAFKDIEVKYEGTSPYLRVSVKSTSKDKFLKNCYYTVEYPDSDSRYAKIGDKVEVTVNYSEYDAEEAGYKIDKETKKIEIKEGEADAYIEKAEQIPEATLTEMKEKATKELEDEIFGDVYQYRSMMSKIYDLSYSYDFDIASVVKSSADGSGYKLDKMMVHLTKDAEDSYYGDYNYVTLVYENQVQDSVCTSPVNVYYAVTFENVILKDDGTIDYNKDSMDITQYAGSMEDINTYFADELEDYNLEEVSY